MKEKGILFSAPMVRALLAGTKLQTRRAMKPQPSDSWSPFSLGEVHKMRDGEFVLDRNGGPIVIGYGPSNEDGDEAYPCPYGQPCDRLWVRETFAIVPRTAYARSIGVQQVIRKDDPYNHDAAVFRADWDLSPPGRWRPSIHMPRWASRITLEITDIRVERLQDISEEDAFSEGVTELPLQKGESGAWWTADVSAGKKLHAQSLVKAYKALWESINGEGSWDKNPWVWCITFRRMQ